MFCFALARDVLTMKVCCIARAALQNCGGGEAGSSCSYGSSAVPLSRQLPPAASQEKAPLLLRGVGHRRSHGDGQHWVQPCLGIRREVQVGAPTVLTGGAALPQLGVKNVRAAA